MVLKHGGTNQSNEADPERYKAGFDGGVDIIATFDVVKPICRNVCFYIQCKCHKEPLTKSAISEVYAGMHARKGTTIHKSACGLCNFGRITGNHAICQRPWCRIIPKNEFTLVKDAEAGLPVPYGNYGNLMRVILYHYTKDVVWIKTLPESQPALGIQSMRDRMIDEVNLDFEQSQTYLDRASSLERKAQEQRQKALDIQKKCFCLSCITGLQFSKKNIISQVLPQSTLDDSG